MEQKQMGNVHACSSLPPRLTQSMCNALVGQIVKNPPTCNAVENPTDREAWWPQSMGSHKESVTTKSHMHEYKTPDHKWEYSETQSVGATSITDQARAPKRPCFPFKPELCPNTTQEITEKPYQLFPHHLLSCVSHPLKAENADTEGKGNLDFSLSLPPYSSVR